MEINETIKAKEHSFLQLDLRNIWNKEEGRKARRF